MSGESSLTLAVVSPQYRSRDAELITRKTALELIIEAGVDVNEVSPDGRTALMIAAERGYTESLIALIVAGADLNRRDNIGYTAFNYAWVLLDTYVSASL